MKAHKLVLDYVWIAKFTACSVKFVFINTKALGSVYELRSAQILAVVTLPTFALGKLDLLTVLPRET